jgi:Na+-driven multidrug efflux pump
MERNLDSSYFSLNGVPTIDNGQSFKRMSINIFKVAIPAIIAMAAALLIEVINISFIGHLGDPAKVAGVGLGNLYINIFC